VFVLRFSLYFFIQFLLLVLCLVVSTSAVIAWKDSSPKWPVMCRMGHT